MKMQIIIGVVVAVLLAGGFAGYKVYKKQQAAMMMPQTETQTSMSVTPTAMVPTVTPVPTASLPANGNSDAALNSDAADLNTKLNALNQDSTNIDSSLNDQQGNLSEN